MGLIRDIIDVFNMIDSSNIGSGPYNIDFHVHTPGSLRDYKIDDISYENLDIKILIEYTIRKKYFNREIFEHVPIEELNKDEIIADIIVREAIRKNINLIILTDHHSVAWYEKIMQAKRRILRGKNAYFNVVPGVEIKSSRYHIVAILDPENYKIQWENLKKLIEFDGDEGSDKLGTTKSVIDVLKSIHKIGAISCLPHLDTYKRELLQGDYWIRIFNSDYLDIIGLNNINHIDVYKQKAMMRKKHIAFVRGSDAHSPEDIGLRYSTMKMYIPNYHGLRECIENYNLRIVQDEKRIDYIRALAIRGGFLGKRDKELQVFAFNPDLNCIIGGRGAGKSTIIKYLISLFSQRFSLDEKDFLGSANDTLIYFFVDSTGYCLCLHCISVYDPYSMKHKYWDGGIEGTGIDLSNKLKLYKIHYSKTSTRATLITDADIRNRVLAKIFPETYAQTEIQQIASNPKRLSSF